MKIFPSPLVQLEVLHGVLNDVEANHDKTFFYLRNPVQMGSMDEKEHKVTDNTGLITESVDCNLTFIHNYLFSRFNKNKLVHGDYIFVNNMKVILKWNTRGIDDWFAAINIRNEALSNFAKISCTYTNKVGLQYCLLTRRIDDSFWLDNYKSSKFRNSKLSLSGILRNRTCYDTW